MIDFEMNDKIKYLPCMHTFHCSCIDSWLVRSLYCPSCMEPVDAGLLSAFDND
jgi:E3 ubiquitin-protein ligase RNF11